MLEFEPGLFIWTAVSFGLLVALLYRVALPPILDFLARREKLIAGQLQEAAENQKRSAELLEQHKKELAQVHQKAELILAESREEGRRVRDDLIAKANSEAERLSTKAQFDLAREKEGILAQAKQEIVELVIGAASKVVRHNISADDDRALIEKSLQEQRG